MGLATAVTLASLGMSAYQGIKGAQAEAAAKQAAQDAANQAARIAEADKFQSLQVPTLGLELAQQNIQADQANQLRALQEAGGASGVLGGLTALNQQSRAQDLQLAAQGNQLQSQRDQMLAQNAQQIEQGRMQREFAMNQAKLAGAQQAASEGRMNQAAAIQGGISALSNAATLDAYRDIYGNNNASGTGIPKGTQFLGDIGYALGLGGTNATPLNTTMVNAQEAFKPTIQGMAPSGTQTPIKNVGIPQMQTNIAQQKVAALGDAQAQFDSMYRYNPYTGQWMLKK